MSKPNLSVNLAGIAMKNPVTTASGTFGYGFEYDGYFDIEQLGALTVKSISLHPRLGNPPPRIHETAAGMLNAVGLQNPGVEVFCRDHLPALRRLTVPVIVSIAGGTVEEYREVASHFQSGGGVAGLELNVSCPNVKEGGMQFGSSPGMVETVVSQVKKTTSLPLIVKLSPNVTDIVGIAKAAVGAGADALSLINTLLGLAIDIKTRRPVLGNVFGGLSGPAIKPVALRMVWQVAQAVEVPIIGMGGIMNADDAVEFLLAGASAVAVGTGNFVNPLAPLEVIAGLSRYCQQGGTAKVTDLIARAWKG